MVRPFHRSYGTSLLADVACGSMLLKKDYEGVC